ncbi:hypothetical protein [Pseudarcicella hirudinis]|nr:hypothetical protein [Pseudarcicella hirudinis]
MIKLRLETLRLSVSGRITGTVYINLSKVFFPEETWNDFPLTIFNWWSHSFLNGNEGDYRFMDGPFYFKIIKKNGLYFLEGFFDRKLIVSTELDIDEFQCSLIHNIEILLNTIKKNKWDIDANLDIELLNENLCKLKKNI